MSSCVHEYICIFTTLCRDTYSYFLLRVSCMEHIICLALNVLCINASVYPAFFIRAKIVCLFLFCFALSTLKTYETVIYNVCMLLSFFFLSFFLISFLLVFLSFFYFLSFFFLMLVLRIV